MKAILILQFLYLESILRYGHVLPPLGVVDLLQNLLVVPLWSTCTVCCVYPNSSPLTDIPLYPTPQHEACNHGYVEMASLLLDHGALVNIPGFENDTPLHDAVVNGHMQVASLLVARGANINIRYDWDYSFLSYLLTYLVLGSKYGDTHRYTSVNYPTGYCW